MKRTLLALLIVTAFVSQSFAQAATVKITPAERKIAEAVTAKQLSEYLYFVASDEMEGRDTPSRGLDTVAKFIAMNLGRWGFKPVGDNGTYFQRIALTRESPEPEKTALEIDGQALHFGDDFYRVSGGGTVKAPLVFASNGWLVRSKGIDAYAGVDVSGKIVVLYSSTFNLRSLIPRPPTVTDDDLKGEAGVEWADPLAYAKKRGAAGVIVIAPPQVTGMWQQLGNVLGRTTLYPDKLRDTPVDKGLNPPVFLVSEKIGDAIFAGESGNKNATVAFEMTKSARLNAAANTEHLITQNVVALWEGSDPSLKNEMVAIGAHYDHIGISRNTNLPDRINNGADDDGSGTVAVLSIAEALAHAPKRPKRSVLFVWHCGEEKGLWGSKYFNKYPTVDIKNVVAQLNIDMIGRSQDPNNIIKCDAPGKKCNEELSKADEIYVIGKDMMSTTLGTVVDSTNKSYLNLVYNTKYDDPKDKNRFFFRSDHFNYAMNGIPITFWFDGVHEDYHQPGDEPQKIDYNKMEKVTRTIMLTLLELTDLRQRPKVDKTLPPELTQR